MENIEEKKRKWRLVLDECINEKMEEYGGVTLGSEDMLMDMALSSIYNEGASDLTNSKSAGRGKSSPNIAKWLDDVRTIFPKDIVTIIQKDAIERKGLTQIFYEPETLENITPDIDMVAMILALKDQIPEKSKDAARELISKLVKEIMEQMESGLVKAVTGSLNRKKHSYIPNFQSIDWKMTISKNIKNYNSNLKKIIPEKFYFFESRKMQKNWTVILDIDQSGSMMDSIIYSSIMGAIFASIPTVETKVIAFDTEVVDLTEVCRHDPVDVLYGVQLGGGTDISKSVSYCRQFMGNTKNTLFILISDLYEGGLEAKLLHQLNEIKDIGVTVLVLLALTDRGIPSYDEKLATKIANLDIPCFGCTPDRLPDLIGLTLAGDGLMEFNKDFVK